MRKLRLRKVDLPEVSQLVNDVCFLSLLGERPSLEFVSGNNGKGHSLESKELQKEGEQAVCLGVGVSPWGCSMQRQPYDLHPLPSGQPSHLRFPLIPYPRNHCFGAGEGGFLVPLPGRWRREPPSYCFGGHHVPGDTVEPQLHSPVASWRSAVITSLHRMKCLTYAQLFHTI